jgi:hypothetical protein
VARNVTNILNQDERGSPSGDLRHDQVAHMFDSVLTGLEQSSRLIQDHLIKPTNNLIDMVCWSPLGYSSTPHPFINKDTLNPETPGI